MLWTGRYNDPEVSDFVTTDGKGARGGPEDIGAYLEIPIGVDKDFLYELYTETPNLQAGTFVRGLRESVFSSQLFMPDNQPNYQFVYTSN